MWMNRYDIDDAVQRWTDHPVLGPAARTLDNLRRAIDNCSDGWAYWQPPSRAAAKLMELLEQGRKWQREKYQRPQTAEPTLEQLKKAYVPLKSFRTRRGVDFGIEVPGKAVLQ